ncbi:NlpC/P60 family protein [Limoniibacter endophyticus]|uniref:Peptidase n=1 Tax=Limoniibacter endophyticus TaxID=1565040 RepID=A0A8J3DM10_9HYPH|nr:NlpC/P60 family protein [Limoniibacter endophyticus]GHC69288.1 peptidase [Limoniibacter endophyticus]
MMRTLVLDEARTWIGTPYRHQASVKGVGCDCLGLVRGIWCTLYGREPERPAPYARDWDAREGERMLEAAARHCVPVVQPQPGDLILFRWRAHLGVRHMGILDEGKRFIHAYEGNAVVSSPLVPAWERKIAASFAFPPAV